MNILKEVIVGTSEEMTPKAFIAAMQGTCVWLIAFAITMMFFATFFTVLGMQKATGERAIYTTIAHRGNLIDGRMNSLEYRTDKALFQMDELFKQMKTEGFINETK